MIVSKALYNYIEAAIEDYYAEGFRPNLLEIGVDIYNEQGWFHLSMSEIRKAVRLVAKEVIAK